MRHLLPSLAIALAACASTADPGEPTELEKTLADPRNAGEVDRVCFTRGIDGFRDNKDQTVIVTRGVDDDYLLVLRNCPQLDRAQSLGVGKTPGSCLRRSDRIIVSESIFDVRGPGQVGLLPCFVNGIYRWDENALASEADEADG